MPEGSVLSRPRKAIFETGISLPLSKTEEQSKTLGRGRPWCAISTIPFGLHFTQFWFMYVLGNVGK